MSSKASKTRRRARRAGMTLIEIMIVVVIMAMMAAAAGIGAMSAMKDNRLRMAKTDVHHLGEVADAYAITQGKSCPTLADLKNSSLLRRGSNTEDPWGNPYQLLCEEGETNVRSSGPDGQNGTEDDIALFETRL